MAVVLSAKYKNDIKELDVVTIIRMADDIKDFIDFKSFEFMKAALGEYQKRTGKVPGHIGAVATAIESVYNIIKEAKLKSLGSREVLMMIYTLF